jgi:hypothetical protein
MHVLRLSVLPAMLCIREHTPASAKPHTAAYAGVEAAAASLLLPAMLCRVILF